MKKKFIILLLCLILIALVFGIRTYMQHYVWISGSSVSRDASSVDLTDRSVSLRDYRKLRQELPECAVRWNVPFQGSLLDSDTQVLSVTSLTPEDLDMLELFPKLSTLDAAGCTDYNTLLEARNRLPGCQVTYWVSIGGTQYDSDVRQITVTDPDTRELEEKLACLPHLEKVLLQGTLPPYRQLEALRQAYPQTEILWVVSLDGRTYSSEFPNLNFSGISLDRNKVDTLLQWFPKAAKIIMRDCGLSDREMMALADDYPQLHFVWDMTFRELQLSTDLTEIDISGQLLESTREIEDLLPYFPKVQKVIMSHCGFDDETMAALNERYDDIRFVWSIQVQDVFIRTDTTFFYPFKYHRDMKVDNDDLYPLRYCTDIVAVDIGHMWAVTDCEWAAFMPDLTYLILVETQITDLSPLKNCKKLAFLEIFKTQIRDYSPLVHCTSLVNINMCRTYGDYRPLLQMPWLETVYWNGIAGTRGYPCSGAEKVLPEALPNTRWVFNGYNNSYYNGWRDLDNYKRMRDVMGMFYLR